MKTGCLGFVIILVINLVIGGWSVGEILSWFGKDIPTVWDVVIGVFAGEVTIPVAAVGWVLKTCGVFTPPIV